MGSRSLDCTKGYDRKDAGVLGAEGGKLTGRWSSMTRVEVLRRIQNSGPEFLKACGFGLLFTCEGRWGGGGWRGASDFGNPEALDWLRGVAFTG